MERDVSEREVIKVIPGVPFRLPDSFTINQSIEQTSEMVEIGSLDLDIEGVGKGKLRVLRISDDGQWIGPIRTPLGPIASTMIRTDDKTEWDPNSLPLEVEIIVENVKARQADNFGCSIRASGSRFQAEEYEGSLKVEGNFNLIFENWIDTYLDAKRIVWFPQDPEARALKDGLEFTITFVS